MPGGYIQLAAVGSRFYLTINPQISFFKTVYRRYTIFPEWIIIDLIRKEILDLMIKKL